MNESQVNRKHAPGMDELIVNHFSGFREYTSVDKDSSNSPALEHGGNNIVDSLKIINASEKSTLGCCESRILPNINANISGLRAPDKFEQVELTKVSSTLSGNGHKRALGNQPTHSEQTPKEDEKQKDKEFPLIGVEPVIFLTMLGIRFISVVEEAFFLYKACSANLGLPHNVCLHINEEMYKNYSAQVQIEVSFFHQYNSGIQLGLPACLVVFFGAWSDKVGRKAPLLLGLIGSCFYSFMLTVISYNEHWRLETVFFGATIPGSLSGRDWIVQIACFAYLSDTTSTQQRTFRNTILGICNMLPMPLGIALGTYLYAGPFQRSYTAMFLTTTSLMAISIVYTLIFIPWKTFDSSEHKGKVCSFSHVSATVKAVARPRDDNRRQILIMALIIVALILVVKDEVKTFQLYTYWKFHWNVVEYNTFKIFEASSFTAGLLIIAPLIQNFFKLKDKYIVIIGGISFVLSRGIYLISKTPLWFYIGAACSIFGAIVTPTGRSIISKTVHVSERGKIFAAAGIIELCIRLLASVVYSKVYILTIKAFPEAFLLVTLACHGAVLVMGLFLDLPEHEEEKITTAEKKSKQHPELNSTT